MDELDAPLFNQILSHLSARDCCALACVRASWRVRADTSTRWQSLLFDTFALREPTAPGACPSDVGDTAPSFKAAYAAWSHRFAEYADGAHAMPFIARHQGGSTLTERKRRAALQGTAEGYVVSS
jgi:hypothetical protein